jgi:hypothetical protein
VKNSIMRRFLPLAFAILVVFGVSRTDLNGYATVGHSWGTSQVLYYINPQNIWLPNAVAISAIQTAALGWTAQTLANIQLVYAGNTNGSSLILNNKNEVFFRNDSSGYIGETYWWYDYTGHLVDADIVFHEKDYPFFTVSGCSGGVYLEDNAIHEFGHFLGLAHTSVSGATMQPVMPGLCDLTQMTLESDDISGIESLYPSTGQPRNTAPTVSISAPASGSSFASAAIVSFSGSASDSQDGNLTSSLSWTSSIDGTIGSGGSFTRVLSAGSHVITASARDTAGLTGSSQVTVTVAAAPTNSVSPDGTMIPTATQIVDNVGAVWTIGANSAILRNGVHAGGGWGTKILWKSATIYVYGTDTNWWQWTGSAWLNIGTTVPGGISASPDGTMVPSALQIVDTVGAVWTIGANSAILRNGVHAGGGWGTKILWKSATIYVYGTDTNWWQWTGSGWLNVGTTVPGGSSASPDGTMVPSALQIVDTVGAVWTIGANSAILRNGVQAASGWGSKILWKSNAIYVLGIDSNWWQWTGSGWINVGSAVPGGTSASPDGTMVPTATQILDNVGAVWTIGANSAIVRNGVQTSGGLGSKILWKYSTIYVFGIDSNWWRWTGSVWAWVGPTQP